MAFHRSSVAAATCFLLAAGLAHAGSQWQDNSLTYVGGGDFKVAPAHPQTVTFEHASGWSVGDLFLFVDLTRFSHGRGNTCYGELGPRFSYAKLSGQGPRNGIVRDVLLATTLEFGEGEVETLLAGPGRALQVGVEYSHWRNKYGIRDSAAFHTNERALSVIVQSHF